MHIPLPALLLYLRSLTPLTGSSRLDPFNICVSRSAGFVVDIDLNEQVEVIG